MLQRFLAHPLQGGWVRRLPSRQHPSTKPVWPKPPGRLCPVPARGVAPATGGDGAWRRPDRPNTPPRVPGRHRLLQRAPLTAHCLLSGCQPLGVLWVSFPLTSASSPIARGGQSPARWDAHQGELAGWRGNPPTGISLPSAGARLGGSHRLGSPPKPRTPSSRQGLHKRLGQTGEEGTSGPRRVPAGWELPAPLPAAAAIC